MLKSAAEKKKKDNYETGNTLGVHVRCFPACRWLLRPPVAKLARSVARQESRSRSGTPDVELVRWDLRKSHSTCLFVLFQEKVRTSPLSHSRCPCGASCFSALHPSISQPSSPHRRSNGPRTDDSSETGNPHRALTHLPFELKNNRITKYFSYYYCMFLFIVAAST